MAATVSVVEYDVFGTRFVRYVDVTGDSSYSSGGYLINPVQIGLGIITGAMPLGGNAAAAVYKAYWSNATSKVIFSETAANTVSLTASGTISSGTITPAGTVTSGITADALTPTATAGAPNIQTVTSATATSNKLYSGATVTLINQTAGTSGVIGVQAPGMTVGALTPTASVSSTFSGAAATPSATITSAITAGGIAAGTFAEPTSVNVTSITFRMMFVGT
jgi:hypothetical protein